MLLVFADFDARTELALLARAFQGVTMVLDVTRQRIELAAEQLAKLAAAIVVQHEQTEVELELEHVEWPFLKAQPMAGLNGASRPVLWPDPGGPPAGA